MMTENKKNNTKTKSILTTGLLIVIFLFLFNFNYDVFKAGADVGPVIGEGTGGYIPKWVPPTATIGSLTNTPCTIPSGGSTCTSTLTWNLTNPIGASTITHPGGGISPASPFNAVPNNAGSRLFTFPRSSSGHACSLSNNGFSTETTVATTCAGGTVWNGTVCAPAAGTVTLVATPTAIITTGGSITLEWSSPAGSVCTSSDFDVGAGGATGTSEVSPTVTTEYTVTCDGTSASVTVTVRKKPIFTEE